MQKGKTFLKGRTGKPPISKTQQVFHTKTVFDELEFVMKITTSSKTPQRENPNKNQER